MDDSEMVDIGGNARLWSVSETANLLNVTTKTVYRHIQDGMVGSVRVGPRLLRIPHAELMAFLRVRSKKRSDRYNTN
jgi:excisionase family DNA binding protein